MRYGNEASIRGQMLVGKAAADRYSCETTACATLMTGKTYRTRMQPYKRRFEVVRSKLVITIVTDRVTDDQPRCAMG